MEAGDRSLPGLVSRVVRLHDGDPCLYGASGRANRPAADAPDVEVVPGLSAYQATAAALQAENSPSPRLVQTIVLSRASGRTACRSAKSLERLAALRASLCLYPSCPPCQEVQEVPLASHYLRKPLWRVGYRGSAGQTSGCSWVPVAEDGYTSRERN